MNPNWDLDDEYLMDDLYKNELNPIRLRPEMEQLIQISSDSVLALREQDVYRVLDQNPDKRNELKNYIAYVRPDLSHEVMSAYLELTKQHERKLLE